LEIVILEKSKYPLDIGTRIVWKEPMVIIYCLIFGTVPKSKVMMHPNPGCGIIVFYGIQPFKVTVDVQLLALSYTLVT
jgi:hypothetical protein